MFSRFLVLATFTFLGRSRAVEEQIKCTSEFCEEYIEKFSCPSTNELCLNSTRSLTVPSPTVCNCCEQCFVFQDLDDLCIVGGPGQQLPNVICKPGTECIRGTCREKTTPDVDFYPGYECENETCHCAVLVNGTPQRIFGKFPQTPNTASEKQCACSAFVYRAHEIIRQILPYPDIQLPVPRCLPNGQYDPLQCIDEMCGCVNSSTGTWDAHVTKVHVKALAPNEPHCFNVERHVPGEYFTTCERERRELMQELVWSEKDDVELILSHKVECRPDGEYTTPP